MPIAKTASQVTGTEAPVHSVPPSTISNYEVANIPIDYYYRYSVDISAPSEADKEKLQLIHEWAKKDSETLGDALIKLSKLEGQLGWSGFDKMMDKVHRYVKLTLQMEDLDKRRQSLERPKWF